MATHRIAGSEVGSRLAPGVNAIRVYPSQRKPRPSMLSMVVGIGGFLVVVIFIAKMVGGA